MAHSCARARSAGDPGFELFFLLKFAGWPQSASERAESLEQLRALDRGVRIKVVDAASPSIGVDTIDDLERVRALVAPRESSLASGIVRHKGIGASQTEVCATED